MWTKRECSPDQTKEIIRLEPIAEPMVRKFWETTIKKTSLSHQRLNSKFIRELGTTILPVAKLTDDDEVLSVLCNMVISNAEPDYGYFALLCARWAQHGFITLQLTGQQFSAFAFSNISADQLEQWHSPWPIFRIPVPENLMDSDKYAVNGITFGKLNICLEQNSGFLIIRVDAHDKQSGMSVHIWRTAPDPYKMYELSTERLLSDEMDSLGEGWGEEDERILSVTKSVVLNACIAATDRSALEYTPPKKRKSEKSIPHSKVYKLNTVITVDARRHVRNLICGTSDRQYTARWLVSGHWRNQPFGLNRSKIKRKFIEPYWKGPEKGTVVEHTYKIEKHSEEQP